MLIAILLSALLIALCTALHFAALRGTSLAIDPRLHPGRCLATAVALIAVALATEALAYAAGFWLAEHGLGIGALRPTHDDAAPLGFIDFYYFSLVNFTTLGRGDLIPEGHLRFMTGMSAFHGFLLITASGSYVLQVMPGRDPFATRD